MKKNIIPLIAMMLSLSVFLPACEKKNNNESATSASSSDISSIMNDDNDLMQQSSGGMSCGYQDADIESLTYSGEDVSVPYYIESTDENNGSDVSIGLLIFVDGEVQPFRVEDNDKNGDEESMHIFHMKSGEKKKFNILFTPINGKKDETIGFLPVTVWNPEYQPGKSDNSSFGNTYETMSNVPLPLHMKKSTEAKTTETSVKIKYTDIPEKIKDQYEGTELGDTFDAIDASPNLEIESKNSRVEMKEDGSVDLTFNAYGGAQITRKMTVFVNNQPVKIDNGDYVKYRVKKNKMCQIKVKLDKAKVSDGDVIYAIAVDTGKDYRLGVELLGGPILVTNGD